MAAMFSTNRAAQGQGNGSLVEFKAGRSKLETLPAGGTKRKVVAEKTKGVVYIRQSPDQLMHFCWKNRETGAVVDDLIIFPGDTEFKEVKGCPDGKVYMLKFKSSKEYRLFWLQDGNVDVEKELVQKVNDALNKPPSSSRAAARGGSSERGGAIPAHGLPASSIGGFGPNEETGALGSLDQNQLMQLLQFMNQGNAEGAGMLPSLAPPANTDTPTLADPINPSAASSQEINQLNTLLRNLEPRPGSSNPAVSIDLSDAIAGDKVLDSIRNNADRLSPHLPQSEDPKQELETTVRSPQFRQASDIFGHAFSTGQMAPVLEQFNIPEEATKAAASGNLLEFARRLTEAEQGTSNSNNASAGGSAQSGAGSSAEEDNEDSNEPKEPQAKRGKKEADEEDKMDLD
ncbi:hypothetical protein WR25_17307 isoform A [Diploscapter pachys]|uniref:Proteasomal ubiquitin receptor ADRM1 homolog n=1 Tax=Diploscapter pachys TaxID=2018661 RepID=A0A2A2L6R1_9BILA|nr:hypothetical protein WR25_17307 isoform A [Diploscapter pachys]